MALIKGVCQPLLSNSMQSLGGGISAWFAARRLRRATKESVPELAFASTRAKCVDVYDGDTVTLASPLRDGGKHLYKVRCRIVGIDTPELRTKNPREKEAARSAKTATEALVLGRVVRVQWHGRDKYGRQLVTLWSPVHAQESVGDVLIAQGHARSYDGTGPRTPFDQWSPIK